MNSPIETINLKNNTRVEIYIEDYPESTREWDNLGTMICWHSRYNLGDNEKTKKYEGDKVNFDDPDDFREWIKDNPSIILPLYLYDHSGITMNTSGFYDPWDSGQVGYIYVTYAKLKDEYGYKYITAKRKEKINTYLIHEVEAYDQYLTGDVYGYKVICNECEEEIDSCWGFFGQDWKENGLLESASEFTCECQKLEDYII